MMQSHSIVIVSIVLISRMVQKIITIIKNVDSYNPPMPEGRIMDLKKRTIKNAVVYSGVIMPANPADPLLRFSLSEKDTFLLRGFKPRNRLLVQYRPTKDKTRAKILDLLEK